jgi:hypothetical protein
MLQQMLTAEFLIVMYQHPEVVCSQPILRELNLLLKVFIHFIVQIELVIQQRFQASHLTEPIRRERFTEALRASQAVHILMQNM